MADRANLKELRDLFQSLDSETNIKNALESSTDPDGESLFLEFKGTGGAEAGAKQPSKEAKKNLAKEISAFANTYGGVVIFHDGKGVCLSPFVGHARSKVNNALQSWLVSCLEPPLAGIEGRDVDGYFTVFVPASENRPHRSQPDSRYYHRIDKSSALMPESMVSALYRMGDVLNAEVDIKLDFTGMLSVGAFNQSALVGTRPRFTVYLWADRHVQLDGEDSVLTRKKIRPIFDDVDADDLFEGLEYIGCLQSGRPLAEEVLYPEDDLRLNLHSNLGTWHEARLMVASVFVNFAEAPAFTQWRFFTYDGAKEYNVRGNLSFVQRTVAERATAS